MLVVIGIIAILVALLLPALEDAKESSRRISCAANLHSASIGLEMYVLDNSKNEYPMGDWGAFEGFNKAHLVLPYFDNTDAMFICPSSPIRKISNWVPSYFGTQSSFSIGYHYLAGFGCLSHGGCDPTQTIERSDGYAGYCCGLTGGSPVGSAFEPVWYKDKVPSDPYRAAILMDQSHIGRQHGHWTPPYFIWNGGMLDNHESLDDDPAGNNIMFVDGRVEWLNFKGIRYRDTKYRQRFRNYYVTLYW